MKQKRTLGSLADDPRVLAQRPKGTLAFTLGDMRA